MTFIFEKKYKNKILIDDINQGDIVSLIVGKRTPNINEKEVYCYVNKIRYKKNTNIKYGIEVIHLNMKFINNKFIFEKDTSQPIKNNNPQKTKDPRKYGYNRINYFKFT